MTKYRSLDLGKDFIADTSEELIGLIRDDHQYIRTDNSEDFMKKYAKHLKFLSGALIRTDTADNFVNDLIAAGDIDIKEDSDVFEEK